MAEQLAVLIVDDDLLDRMAVKRALKATGAALRIVEADSSEAAFALLQHDSFDCMLLDYLLPPTDGLTVIRELRARGIPTPVVVLTGQGDERVAVALMKAGATDYLTKEALTPELLAQSLRHAVRVHKAEVQASQALMQSVERLRFLAEASRALMGSLDTTTILEELTRLVVPALADWCAVDMLDQHGALEREALAAPAATSDDWAAMLAQHWPVNSATEQGPMVVLASGAPLVVPAIGQLGASHNTQFAPALAELATLVCVPITIRDQIQGTISFARRGPERPYNIADLTLMGELAQRVAAAFDNAQLYQEARAAVRLRDEFLSIASHELRTPLTSLLGYVQLLERRLTRGADINERERRAVKVIVEQVVRLNKMISALLDVSRLQSGQFALQQAPLNLASIVAQVVEELRPTLESHTIELRGEAQLLIMGDELRLHQVLQNLLQNAVKYSPAGGIITVRLERQRREAYLLVSDQGIGIPTEDLPHLFRRFYRAANAEERRISGIGLGLYVVHEIVALHGGTIEVDSHLGQGSTFAVRLPLLDEASLPADNEPHHPLDVAS